MEGMRHACFLGVFACTLIVCWGPLVAIASVLLYFAVKDKKDTTYAECEIPLDTWALVLASSIFLLSLIQAVLYCVTSCKITLPAKAGAADGTTATDAGAKAGEVKRTKSIFASFKRNGNQGQGDDPSAKDKSKAGQTQLTTLMPCGCCSLVLRDGSLSDSEEKWALATRITVALICIFIFSWIIVGAMWVLPFREQHLTNHHCNPYLLGFSFYLLLAALFGIFAAVACCCLIACISLTVGATLWAGVESMLRKLFSWMHIDPSWADMFGVRMQQPVAQENIQSAAAAGFHSGNVVSQSRGPGGTGLNTPPAGNGSVLNLSHGPADEGEAMENGAVPASSHAVAVAGLDANRSAYGAQQSTVRHRGAAAAAHNVGVPPMLAVAMSRGASLQEGAVPAHGSAPNSDESVTEHSRLLLPDRNANASRKTVDAFARQTEARLQQAAAAAAKQAQAQSSASAAVDGSASLPTSSSPAAAASTPSTIAVATSGSGSSGSGAPESKEGDADAHTSDRAGRIALAATPQAPSGSTVAESQQAPASGGSSTAPSSTAAAQAPVASVGGSGVAATQAGAPAPEFSHGASELNASAEL